MNVSDATTTHDLLKKYASSATTHGVRRISETGTNAGKIIWAVIFVFALSACGYHCSFLILKYFSYGIVTTTEEIHAKELDFPALTVCNLNILKKKFLEDQLEKNRNTTHERNKGFCFEDEVKFLAKSNAKDLSDIWNKLGVTLDHLKNYGHKVYDLIVQCTYNAKDCFNQSIKPNLPLVSENITIADYISTRLGYCHTIKLNASTLGKVRRTGQTLGLTLTLWIEREHYWNLISPEYGVRIMIHPRHTFPTVDRGGIVLHPGTKTYLSIRVREIERLPAPYGDCSESFEDSPLSVLLKGQYDEILNKTNHYTYEFCQLLCREIHLLKKCQCVEEQVKTTHKFCNPCYSEEDGCRLKFRQDFDENENNECTQLCKPACMDTRYDVTLSNSEWPNFEFLEFVVNRWPDLKPDFVETPDNVSSENIDYSKMPLNESYINKNFMRVHIFMQEMNYLHFKDNVAYSLPELFADLGGCLGLYIGVSLISIMEIHELLLHIVTLFFSKLNRSFVIDHNEQHTDRHLDLPSRYRSKSVEDLMRKTQKVMQDHYRQNGPAPPVFFVRERKSNFDTNYKNGVAQAVYN